MAMSTIGLTDRTASTKSPTPFVIFDALATFARPFSTSSLMNICRLAGSSSSTVTSVPEGISCSASRTIVRVFTYDPTSSAVSSPFFRLSYAAFQSRWDVERSDGCLSVDSVAGGSPSFAEVSDALASAAGARGASDVVCRTGGAVVGAAGSGGLISAFGKACQVPEGEDNFAIPGLAYFAMMLRARHGRRALGSCPATSRPLAGRARHHLPKASTAFSIVWQACLQRSLLIMARNTSEAAMLGQNGCRNLRAAAAGGSCG
jgi:hypothetical protein